MGQVFLTSDPIITLIILGITVILILLGRKLENPYYSLAIIVYSLFFLIYHTTKIDRAVFADSSQLYISSAIDLMMLLLGFITYLWIDTIAGQKKNLKSYGEPLSWFWNKKI